MAWKVKEVQPTPNPNAMKLILDSPISAAPVSYFNAASAAGDPLASSLFSVTGVSGLLLLNDFVTVNKQADAKWKSILPRIQEILENFSPQRR